MISLLSFLCLVGNRFLLLWKIHEIRTVGYVKILHYFSKLTITLKGQILKKGK